MGVRKKLMADRIKEERKSIAFARLNDCPTSPRKMRLVADLVRGKQIELALAILRYNSKEASKRLEKLVLSAVANWQAKNEDSDVESANLYVKEITVDPRDYVEAFADSPSRKSTPRAQKIESRNCRFRFNY